METSQLSNIYIPPGAIPLDKVDHNFQLRLGIQGPPGTGKSWSATTFKNPIVLSGDRGLISHMGRADIIEIPFYNGVYVDSVKKRDGLKCPPNRKEALTEFLSNQALKITKDQTFVLDGGSNIQAWYHIWYRQNKDAFITQKGEEDKYAQWRMKAEYYQEIMDSIKALNCDVIYLSHESPDRDKTGELNGQVRPLLTGQFQDELVGHFTDFFRAITIAKPKVNDLDSLKKFKDTYELDDASAKEWIGSTPQLHKTIYLWQTCSDSIVKCKTSLVSCPKFILAHANSFKKYQRVNK